MNIVNHSESQEREYKVFVNDLYADIEKEINLNCYTWSADAIVKAYREKYKEGWYVSHTCKQIILKFKDRLDKLQ